VPGLRGFVGVDVVVGDDPDGGGDAVIEINPRLTTSYAGLRQVARFNLAAALLAVAEGGDPPAFEWRPGPVRWRADGQIERS
jgi:predicted ATP-grasp superfamily ATP-dependent carboligase